MATENFLKGVLGWLRGGPSTTPSIMKPPQEVARTKQSGENSKKTDTLSFLVDEPHVHEFTQVGLSVKLWIPKANPERVYIYHRDGPGGCLGFAPSQYSRMIIAHLVEGLAYEAVIEERTANTCRIKCRLIRKEESDAKRNEERASLRNKLTKAYSLKKPITLSLATPTLNAVTVGDKLSITFDALEVYLQDVGPQRGPYSCQWSLTFCDQSGTTVAVLVHDKSTIQKILKAHFNAYQFDVEVVETFYDVDFSEQKVRSNWEGYPIKVVITARKSRNMTSA